MALSPWRGLSAFFAANVLFGAGLFFHAFLYNFYLEAVGLREGMMGWAQAALTAGGLAGLIPAGRLVDRVGQRATYVAAASICGTGLAVGAVVERPVGIAAAAFVAGIGTVAWRVSMGPILLDLAPDRGRSRAFSWNVGLLLVSGAVWTWLAGSVPGWLSPGQRLEGIRLALLAGAVGTALAALGAAAIPRRRGTTHPRSSAVVRAPPASGFAVAVGAVAVWMAGPALVLPFFNIYFERHFALEIDRVGAIMALTQFVVAGAVFASGELAQRRGPGRMLIVWSALFAPAVWAFAGAGALGLAVVMYVIQAIVSPATNPLIDEILLSRAPVERRGTVSSWRNGATELSGVLGAGTGGWVLETASFGALFALAGGIGALGAGAMWVALRSLGQRTSPAGGRP